MNEILVNEAIAGSKEAFCSLYGQYKDKLYRYALYKLGDPDDAEDAVSDCVLAAWKSIGTLRSAEAFGSWIFRILANQCATRVKSIITARDNLERVYNEGPGSAGNIAVPASLSIELKEALSQLNELERDVVLLSIVGGLNSKEVAEFTGLSPGGVRSKLSRSLAKMREFLS